MITKADTKHCAVQLTNGTEFPRRPPIGACVTWIRPWFLYHHSSLRTDFFYVFGCEPRLISPALELISIMPLYCLPLGLSGLPCLFFSQISPLKQLAYILFTQGLIFQLETVLFTFWILLNISMGMVCVWELERGQGEEWGREKGGRSRRRGRGGRGEEGAEGSEWGEANGVIRKLVAESSRRLLHGCIWRLPFNWTLSPGYFRLNLLTE